ncbi:hypothetical protein [Pelosinus sp. UFO1]|uniref:hypothetical protein n=1 Tax=Pelosinus sp. UFO1 TaxID=484770 RepID=UPI0004D13611|nr:hypothetical protein [Pelosinus sp. UFO1]AIF53524.1 hypothetical protein UFO1_3981 [Pelosinus sp. UFO1]
MLNYLISQGENIIIDLYAEQVFGSIENHCSTYEGGQTKLERGMNSYTLTQSVLSNLFNCLSGIEYSTSQYIVFDFSYIRAIQSNTEEIFSKIVLLILSQKRSVVFANIGMCLVSDVDKIVLKIMKNNEVIEKNSFNSNMFEHYFTYTNLQHLYQVGSKNWALEKQQGFKSILEKAIDEHSITTDKPQFSSTVYSSKYINIKGLMQKTNFFNYCIFQLALKIIKKEMIPKDMTKHDEISLFCQSLNGSYIALILSRLLCVNFMYLDHLGPIANIYKTSFSKEIRKNNKYLIVADVICLGTEVKRVESIIQVSGGECIGSVCIVDCQLTDVGNSEHKLGLITINKQYNPIDYIIRTDFCDKCSGRDSK